MTMLALVGFATTYSGRQYLLVGLVGIVLAAGVAVTVAALRWSVLVTVAGVVGLYFLLGPALLLRNEPGGGALPTADALRSMAELATGGWKQLLTTLPPVASSGPMLFAPFVIGLLATALGVSAAERTRSPWLPVLFPGLAFAAVVLLGTDRPGARLAQGVGLLVLALVWAALRHRRIVPPARNNAGRAARVTVGVGMLVVAGVVAALAGPSAPGAHGGRLVLRTYVKPPFDLAEYPSPLVGFRKYTQAAKNLYDKPLLTVRGLPSGQVLQIATMDNYDGTVWGATNATVATAAGEPIDAFSRVGETIRSDAAGTQVSYSVTVAPNYAAAFDLNAWVATAGVLTSIRFDGPSARELAEQFRYNLYTHAGITTERLASGDSYRVSSVVAPSAALSTNARPYAVPTVNQSVTAFVADKAAQWSGGANSVMAQVLSVAKHLHDYGAWSDGGPGEGQFLPGHSTGRLASFIAAQEPVGDDEQYAATLALMANNLGMPARVVLTATPEDGVVRGRDVHADVQLHVRSAAYTGWVTVPRERYMPDRNKKPKTIPPQEIQDANAANVPPPNPVHPPSTLDDPEQPQQNTSKLIAHKHKAGWQLPGWIVWILRWLVVPLLALLAIALAIVGVKRLRRRQRRNRGSPTDRFASGWREVLDRARDLGVSVPGLATRHEQGRLLAAQPQWSRTAELATAADWGVFGAGERDADSAERYWSDVEATCRSMSRSAPRWRRIAAAVNLRTFAPAFRGTGRRRLVPAGLVAPRRLAPRRSAAAD